MAQKISPSLIKEAVIKEAQVIKRKKEIYSQLLTLNEEIKKLDEQGMIGTFGFANNPNDMSQTTKTGFANEFQNISHVAKLAAEFGEKDAQETSLKEENEALKQELSALKSQIDELTKESKNK